MGINLHAVQLSQCESWFKCDEGSWFDSVRYAGDTAFCYTDDFEWDTVIYNNEFLKRPHDIGVAKQWVMAHVPQGNQARLLDLLSWLECTSDGWILVT